MSIEIVQLESPASLDEPRRRYLASLTAPLDGMWEAFAGSARQLELRIDGVAAGFACLDAPGRLLQFWVEAPFRRQAAAVFDELAGRDDLTGAIVSTADPTFLGVCLDAQRSIRVHTLLCRHVDGSAIPAVGDATVALDPVGPDEIAAIVAHQRTALDQDPGDWLVGYTAGLVERGELHALRIDGEIAATGETRVSESQPPHVDLGVITMRPFRRRGVASHVLARLATRCRTRGLEPICSTTVENVASRRAIGNAGFVVRHRLLEVGL